jgi:hypothetical protein
MKKEIKYEIPKLLLFFTYTVLYEGFIWGMVVGAIYYLHWNEWTVIVGIIMSGAQLKPKHFGLDYNLEDAEEKEEKAV